MSSQWHKIWTRVAKRDPLPAALSGFLRKQKHKNRNFCKLGRAVIQSYPRAVITIRKRIRSRRKRLARKNVSVVRGTLKRRCAIRARVVAAVLASSITIVAERFRFLLHAR